MRKKITDMTVDEIKEFLKSFEKEDLFDLDSFELQSLKNFIIRTIINDERLNRLEERRQNEKKLSLVLKRTNEVYSEWIDSKYQSKRMI